MPRFLSVLGHLGLFYLGVLFSFVKYHICPHLNFIDCRSLVLHSSQINLTNTEYNGSKCFKKGSTPQIYQAFRVLWEFKTAGTFRLSNLLQTIGFYPHKSAYHEKKLSFLTFWLPSMQCKYLNKQTKTTSKKQNKNQSPTNIPQKSPLKKKTTKKRVVKYKVKNIYSLSSQKTPCVDEVITNSTQHFFVWHIPQGKSTKRCSVPAL